MICRGLFLYRGELKSECWLVLTESSLSCYDRHPTGINRQPLSSFCWTDPQNLVVVLSRVDARPSPYMSPSRNQHLFAVEQHSAGGTKRAVFVTETWKEKQEWIGAVEAAITRNSGVLGGEPAVGGVPSTRSSVAAVVTPTTTTTTTRSRRAANRPPRPASTTTCTTSSPDSSVV